MDDAARPSSPSPEDAAAASRRPTAGARPAGSRSRRQRAEVPTAADTAAISRLTDEILPPLIARFRARRMGELEVRRAAGASASGVRPMSWRRWPAPRRAHGADAGRRSRGASAGQGSAGPTGGAGAAAWQRSGRAARSTAMAPRPPRGASLIASSPGVGYFATRDEHRHGQPGPRRRRARPGRRAGRPPGGRGAGRRHRRPLLAEAGEAVEYGQDLVRLEPVTRPDPVREA